MVAETSRITRELDDVFRGPAWHGPAVMEVLSDVTPEAAAGAPAPNAHSIWELVLHMACWKDAARRRLLGEALQVTPEQDFPAVPPPTEDSWRRALATLESAHRALLDAVRETDDSRLDEPVAGEEYTRRFMLHGVAGHDAYHAGQIAVLKRTR